MQKKPPWLKRRLPAGPAVEGVRSLVEKSNLHTVCQEARCPNIWECFSCGTATFLILGSTCTRNCRFCAVSGGIPSSIDPKEPDNVAEAARQMRLSYVVVTSVTRDDLADGGAGFFAQTILALRKKIHGVKIEVLIPDFQGDRKALETVVSARPDVLNHNIETVPRLYPCARPQADFNRSVELLARAKRMDRRIQTKSGMMLGLGETSQEIAEALDSLLGAGCRLLTLGQYLQPSREHLPIERFVPPEEFDRWKQKALAMGFEHVASGPLVRSSYHAKELHEEF